MTDFEYTPSRNFHRGDIYGSDEETIAYEMPLAEQWSLQGIRFKETDPVPTEKYTAGQLKETGYVGIKLMNCTPKSDTADSE